MLFKEHAKFDFQGNVTYLPPPFDTCLLPLTQEPLAKGFWGLLVSLDRLNFVLAMIVVSLESR